MTPRRFSYLVKRFEERGKREDHRTGEILALLYNANRDTEVDRKGLMWYDWFPQWRPEPEEQTEDEMFRAMLMFTKQREGQSH